MRIKDFNRFEMVRSLKYRRFSRAYCAALSLDGHYFKCEDSLVSIKFFTVDNAIIEF